MEQTHYNIHVTGRVQGVFYRKSTVQKAQELGVAGYVRNQPDGSVYIEAEGFPDKLDTLVSWCWNGPELARVQNVRVEDGEWHGFVTFEVR
jgi:acylphosphatase